MASPALRKLSPKSPLTVQKVLGINGSGSQPQKSPRGVVLLVEGTPAGQNFGKSCPAATNKQNPACKRKDFLCTPRSTKTSTSSGRRSLDKLAVQQPKPSPVCS